MILLYPYTYASKLILYTHICSVHLIMTGPYVRLWPLSGQYFSLFLRWFSITPVAITMDSDPSCHTILQKSAVVLGRGPWTCKSVQFQESSPRFTINRMNAHKVWKCWSEFRETIRACTVAKRNRNSNSQNLGKRKRKLLPSTITDARTPNIYNRACIRYTNYIVPMRLKNPLH